MRLDLRWDRHPEVRARFERDAAAHRMEVKLDQGLYRHLRFRAPHTGTYWFDLITTPGTLTINGDMGTFVFSREPDMFGWFGTDSINPDYWGQKLQAVDRDTRIKEFRPSIFREFVLTDFWERSRELEPVVAASVWRAIRAEMLDWTPDDADAAFRVLDEFKAGDWEYPDAWEYQFTDWHPGFLWCCFAIVAGITAYQDRARGLAA